MAKKKTVHTVIRNSNFFCLNCGREQIVSYPIEPYMFSAMANAFTKQHKDCEKTWVPPTIEDSRPLDERKMFWLSNGERGISSETIFGRLSGRMINNSRYPPSDPSDFRRCHLLLELIPEFRVRLSEMKSLSPVWSNLVDNWDKLTEMLLEQMVTQKANGMYELMKSLGC